MEFSTRPNWKEFQRVCAADSVVPTPTGMARSPVKNSTESSEGALAVRLPKMEATIRAPKGVAEEA
jgi:hypothetical protein